MARPLRDVFNDLTGDESVAGTDPAAALRAHGHGDLPPILVSEAVASYTDTAAPEVAEHLAPFVTAYRGILPQETDQDPAGWLDLLATAPAPADDPAPEPGPEAAPELDAASPVEGTYAGPDPFSLDFGTGEDVEPEPGPDPGHTHEAQADLSEAVVAPPDYGDAGDGGDVRDHRGGEQQLPPGEPGDGEAVVRDHREPPIDFDFDAF